MSNNYHVIAITGPYIKALMKMNKAKDMCVNLCT